MNIKTSLLTLLSSFALLAATPAFAQHTHGESSGAGKHGTAPAGKLSPVTEKDAAWAAEARKSYPMEMCVVSDEKLGSMGKSPEYIYRVDGKPDRLVVFCCDGCEEDFAKDPAKHLEKLDAAAKKSKAARPTAGGSK
jgi:hypothetical protein